LDGSSFSTRLAVPPGSEAEPSLWADLVGPGELGYQQLLSGLKLKVARLGAPWDLLLISGVALILGVAAAAGALLVVSLGSTYIGLFLGVGMVLLSVMISAHLSQLESQRVPAFGA
jgi:hypothetical protein